MKLSNKSTAKRSYFDLGGTLEEYQKMIKSPKKRKLHPACGLSYDPASLSNDIGIFSNKDMTGVICAYLSPISIMSLSLSCKELFYLSDEYGSSGIIESHKFHSHNIPLRSLDGLKTIENFYSDFGQETPVKFYNINYINDRVSIFWYFYNLSVPEVTICCDSHLEEEWMNITQIFIGKVRKKLNYQATTITNIENEPLRISSADKRDNNSPCKNGRSYVGDRIKILDFDNVLYVSRGDDNKEGDFVGCKMSNYTTRVIHIVPACDILPHSCKYSAIEDGTRNLSKAISMELFGGHTKDHIKISTKTPEMTLSVVRGLISSERNKMGVDLEEGIGPVYGEYVICERHNLQQKI